MRFTPASITETELADVASRERPSPEQQFAQMGDDELAAEVWRKTLDEVVSGVLEGPLPLDTIPRDYPLSRRFGIRQSGKTRCIDDFSRSAVNSCVQTCESPKPHTIDVFGSLCIHAMAVSGEQDMWCGRTFDLTGAYRQCAVSASSKRYAHILVQDPASQKMFGFSFLRFAYSLWYLLVTEFLVLTTGYFDDFLTLATATEASSVTSCIQLFFRMLGWAFAETGPKAPDFAAMFNALAASSLFGSCAQH